MPDNLPPFHIVIEEFIFLQQEYRNSMPASSYQQQKLRVCEVCSAYLGIHDNDRRLADHFGGKLHLGFITIREKLEELKVGKCTNQIDMIIFLMPVYRQIMLFALFNLCRKALLIEECNERRKEKSRS